MAAILFDGAELFEQIGNTLLTDGPMWNLLKMLKQFPSEKKTFKNYTILYMYIDRGKSR